MWYFPIVHIFTVMGMQGCDQIMNCCCGFFLVEQKGHGIPNSLLKEVKELTRKFFELPYEEKLKIKMTPATGYRYFHMVL